MDNNGRPREATIHITVGVEISDPSALRSYAVSVARSAEQATRADSDPLDALALALDLNALMDPLPGVTAVHGSVETHVGYDEEDEEDEAPDLDGIGELTAMGRDPEVIAAILDSGRKAAGLDLEMLGFDPDLAGEERHRSEARALMLAGMLRDCSVSLIDDLFADIQELAGAGVLSAGDVSDTYALAYLPRRFAHRYDTDFARRFLIVCSDLSMNLAAGWKAPSCVAQELAVKCLLEHTGHTVEAMEIEDRLPGDWRALVQEALLEDTDAFLLYDQALDGFENDPEAGPPGRASMKFDDWFRPFRPGAPVPPYADPE